jgi:hypothetical protein
MGHFRPKEAPKRIWLSTAWHLKNVENARPLQTKSLLIGKWTNMDHIDIITISFIVDLPH